MGHAHALTLIHGARAVVRVRRAKIQEASDGWLGKLIERRNPNIAAVALANKNARIAWALLANDRNFDLDHARRAAA